MEPTRLMDLAQIAHMEEHRQAITLSEIAGDWIEVGGGRAARGAPGVWANIAMGMGLHGPFSREDIDRVIDWYSSVGIEPRFELCPYVSPDFVAQCNAAGLVLKSFENVFVRTLGNDIAGLKPAHNSSLEIRLVNRQDLAMVREYGRCIAAGFSPRGQAPREEHVQAYTRVAQHERTVTLAAMIEGRCVGGGAVEIAGEIASLFAASVLPDFRRRGVQQALMAARLQLAASRGARFATIGAKPGISTERNALRLGFGVAYTKVVLVRPGAGLIGVEV